MKYAVEARFYSNGMVVSKVRETEDGETNSHSVLEDCVVWVDIFGTYREALEFSRGYRRAV